MSVLRSITALRVFALKHLKEKDEKYKDETFVKEGEHYEVTKLSYPMIDFGVMHYFLRMV